MKRKIHILLWSIGFAYVAVYLAWSRFLCWENPANKHLFCFFQPPLEGIVIVSSQGQSNIQEWYNKEAIPQFVFNPLIWLDATAFGRTNASGHFLCTN
jgi:hypothetical protein